MPPVSQAAPPLVEQAVTKVLRASAELGPDPQPEVLHRLRILYKRARYACEFFKEALPGPLDAFVNEAVAFQDLLGAHQDAIVAAGRVRWAAEELQAAGMGALVQVYLESARRDRRDFLTRWDSSRKGLRRLKAEIRKLGGAEGRG